MAREVDPAQLPPRRKMEIVLAGLRGDRSIAAVCEEHRVPEALFFRWREELVDGAARTLAACEQDGASRELLQERMSAMAGRRAG